MNSEQYLLRPRKTVLPPLSSRTLHHPSFLHLYKAAALPQPNRENIQSAHPITPADIFYTDPTAGCGRRIPNMLGGLKVFDGFQLNTPPPIMSACLAPPNRPDPFRSGPHSIRDLGGPTWRMHNIHPQVQPRWVVLQLTQEEDQAITNLLTLHHQMDDGPKTSAPSVASAQEEYKPACGVLREGRVWSGAELEAADTLLSRFKIKDADLLKPPNQNETAKTPPGPLLCQSTRAHREPEPLPELRTIDQNCISLNCAGENGDVWPVEDRSAVLEKDFPLKMSPEIQKKARVFGRFLEGKEQTLSDLEGDAVYVLLSLVDVDVVQ